MLASKRPLHPALPLPLLLLLLLPPLLVLPLCAAKHVRRSGPAARLHGTAVVDAYWDSSAAARKQVRWSADLLADVVTWYDLARDRVRIASCSRAHVQLAGAQIDRADYRPGVVFVIDLEDWQSSCATPPEQRGVPVEDDVLFYRIVSVDDDAPEGSVRFGVTRISGKTVVPEVILDVGEGQGKSADGAMPGEFTIFEGDDTTARQAQVVPTASRSTSNLKSNSTLTDGVNLDFSAGVGASITSFKLTRLIGLRFTWIQRLEAEATATFSVTKEREVTRTGRLLKVPVPGFGFRTRRIPFVGRASAGAFVRVDWVLELNAQTTIAAGFDVRREIRQRVNARVFPPRFDTTNLSPLERNRQTSSLEFGVAAEATVNGFAGVRPALAVEVALGSKSAGGNIGVKVGLELDAGIKTPPFPAVSDGGAKIGVCEECHALEGSLGIRIKDLSLQLEVNRRVTREIVLIGEILGVKVATVCGIPKACGGILPGGSTPSASPSPRALATAPPMAVATATATPAVTPSPS